MQDDDQLMIRIQEGDSRAFSELVDRYQEPLTGFFYRNSRDLQLAEDLTQETLLRVYNQAWDYLPVGKFRGWMYRMARNLLIDNVRRQSHDALIKAVRPKNPEDDILRGLEGDVTSPEAEAHKQEVAVIVDELLKEIPEDQRLTFVLNHYNDLGLAEIADVMETSLSTTKSRLRLAREKLRELLLARGISAPDDPDE